MKTSDKIRWIWSNQKKILNPTRWRAIQSEHHGGCNRFHRKQYSNLSSWFLTPKDGGLSTSSSSKCEGMQLPLHWYTKIKQHPSLSTGKILIWTILISDWMLIISKRFRCWRDLIRQEFYFSFRFDDFLKNI